MNFCVLGKINVFFLCRPIFDFDRGQGDATMLRHSCRGAV